MRQPTRNFQTIAPCLSGSSADPEKNEETGLMGQMNDCNGLLMPEPMPYIQFMSLVFNCRMVITDSGGIQEETSYLGIPCLTVRENTERPVTITHGTNQLCQLDQLRKKRLRSSKERRANRSPSNCGTVKPPSESWNF
jgi:UDP-N-acetylglucosamine 2-epimerase